jgi:hypothetical protein
MLFSNSRQASVLPTYSSDVSQIRQRQVRDLLRGVHESMIDAWFTGAQPNAWVAFPCEWLPEESALALV